MSVEEIRQATRGLVVCGPRDFEVKGVSTDSRTIKPGDLFVALEGETFDGHDYIRKALDSGACGVVYSRDFPIYGADADKVLVKVPDTLTALGDMARAYRRGLQATVIAITGSNGKTTTKEMTRFLLEERMPTVASRASFNNFIGVPLTLFESAAATKAVVLEMGTNHPGEIARLAQIAAPDVGLITNIGRTHLEGLRSIEGVAAAKAELLHGLARDAVAILNADDPRLMGLKALVPGKVFTFGLSETADVFAARVKRAKKGFSFLLNGSVKAELNVPGAYNMYNALAAVSICRCLALDLPYLAARLADFSLPPMRMQEISLGPALLINDAYNANPESMARAIDEFSQRKAKRKFFVFADMMELGPDTAQLHRELGERAARAGFDFCWAVGPLSRHAVDVIAEMAPRGCRARHFGDLAELGRALKSELKDGDVVLIKGSRAMALERLIDRLR